MKRKYYQKGMLVLLLIFALTACGKEAQKDTTADMTEEISSDQETAEETEEVVTTEEIVADPTPEPTPEGIDVDTIKGKYENILTDDSNGAENGIFLGWNAVDGYSGYWFNSMAGNYYTEYDFKADDVYATGFTICAENQLEFHRLEIEKYFLKNDTLQDMEELEFDTWDKENKIYYIIFSNESKDVVNTIFGDVDIRCITYAEYYDYWEEKDYYGDTKTYEAGDRLYKVYQEEYAVVENLGHKAYITMRYPVGNDSEPEYRGALKNIIPQMFG